MKGAAIMSYKSIRTITSTTVFILLAVGYNLYVIGPNSPYTENLRSWSVATLICIGIAVIAQIIIQILFHIVLSIKIAVKDQETDDKKIERIIASSAHEDEMDNLIKLKSSHVRSICTGVSILAALAALALGTSAVVALRFMFWLVAVGTVAEGITSVYYYEKGVER